MRVAVILLLLSHTVSADYQFENLGNGFRAMTKLADPFSDQREFINFTKDNFTFNCQTVSLLVNDDLYYDGFSFSAKIALKVDNHQAIIQTGKNSSYLGGSDLITSSDYYSTKLTKQLVQQLKAGNELTMAGKTSTGSWKRAKLNLRGFSKAYNKVCQ